MTTSENWRFWRDLNCLTRKSTSIRPQLDSIFGFVQTLSKLDTEGVEPMTMALDVDNCWRSDTPVPSLPREDALRNAPSSQGEYFLVPPVLGKV